MGSFLGLLLQINADPSQAQAAIAQLEQTTGHSFEEAAASTKPLNDSLLSNRESVRLLSEEMGIHLPRAVSSAISEMLPNIAQLGGALLGVFAVEQVSKWAVAGADAFREWYVQGDESIKDLDTAATAAFKHMQEEAGKVFTTFKTTEAGAFKLEEIEARATQLERYHNAYKLLMDKAGGDLRVLGTISAEAVATIAEANRDGAEGFKHGLDSLTAVDQKIAETGQLQTEARKRQAELTKKDGEEVAQALKGRGREEEQAAKEVQRLWEETTHAQYEYFQKALKAQSDAENKSVAQEVAYQEQIARGQAELQRRMWAANAALAKELTKEIAGTNKEFEKMALHFQVMTPLEVKALVQLVPAFKTAGAAQSEYMEITRMAHTVTTEFIGGVRTQIAAIREDYVGALEGVGSGLAALIGGQKGAAVFKAGYEVAEGIACLASGTWPPNPAAIIAAGLHFEAAAQFAMMGGGGGGGSRSVGGGSSGSQSRYGVGGGGGGSTGIGPAQPGGGRGPLVIWNQYGPAGSNMKAFGVMVGNTLSQLTRTGQVKLVATTALTNGPKIT